MSSVYQELNYAHTFLFHLFQSWPLDLYNDLSEACV